MAAQHFKRETCQFIMDTQKGGAGQYPDEDEELELLYQEELAMQKEQESQVSRATTSRAIPAVERADQFPDEDEEYEFLYQQELENESSVAGTQSNVQANSSQQTVSEFGGLSGIAASTAVNRRLFGTPVAERITSTPLGVSTKPAKDHRKKRVFDEIVEVDQENRASKRRLDLYGDDILLEGSSYVDPVAKKMRAEEERDLRTIEIILEMRRQQNAVEATKNKTVEYLERIRDFKMRNLSYSVPPWPFLPIQRSDQNRIFVRFHSADFESRALNDLSARPNTIVFAPEEKQRLWSEANDIILKRTDIKTTEAPSIAEAVANIELEEDHLWVEKYKPKKYVDLLSAEMTNRNLLFWLKMWDKVVFGKEFKPVSAAVDVYKLNTFNKRTGKFESNGGWVNRRQRQSLNVNTDEHGRPIQKVALLYGSPGLGKTTLAHILARHAGYQPIEINASDDRSPTSFQLALENGTQMTSVLNENGRPNCIILDEIDGAPKQSIEFLVKFVSDSIQVKRPKGSEKAKKNFLKRPIICICNDVYEPALRPLRQIAFVVQFPPVEILRLEERLKQIAKQERMKAGANALYTLAQKTGNDIRCCISTMQFFKAENKPITLHEIIKSNVSRKDQHQGLFSVWTKIFQLERKTERHHAHDNADKSVTASTLTTNSDSGRTQSILNSVQSFGDYQRLMQGVHENFLQQKMPDSNMLGVVEALDWFVFFDIIQHQINHQQNYTIYPYLPIGFVKWNFLFASVGWPNIKFPSKGFEFNQKTASQRHIYESFRKGLKSTPGAISLGIGKGILLEAVPILKRILSPQLRHLPIELFSQDEKDNLRHTVEVMIDLGLTYVQIKSLEGSYQFQMEPPLEMLLQFPGATDMQVSYFTKQMLAREVEHERLRRTVPKIVGKENTNQSKDGTAKAKRAPNHLQKLQPKAVNPDAKSKSTCNLISKYFSNFRKEAFRTTTLSSKVAEAPKSDPIVKSPIWYHYKEGFNNAVRKDIHMKELL